MLPCIWVAYLGAIQSLGTVSFTSYIDEICVKGNYAYVGMPAYGMKVVDVSDPANPSVVGDLPLTGVFKGYGLDVVGNVAAFADMNKGVYIIDVSTPTNPQVSATVTPAVIAAGSEPVDVCIINNKVYVSDASTLKVFVIDITSPAAPSVLSSSAWSDTSVVTGIPRIIAVGTTDLHLAADTAGYRKLSTTPPLSTTISEAVPAAGDKFRDVAQGSGTTFFIAGEPFGLKKITISGATYTEVAAYPSTQSQSHGVVFCPQSTGHVYFVDGYGHTSSLTEVDESTFNLVQSYSVSGIKAIASDGVRVYLGKDAELDIWGLPPTQAPPTQAPPTPAPPTPAPPTAAPDTPAPPTPAPDTPAPPTPAPPTPAPDTPAPPTPAPLTPAPDTLAPPTPAPPTPAPPTPAPPTPAPPTPAPPTLAPPTPAPLTPAPPTPAPSTPAPPTPAPPTPAPPTPAPLTPAPPTLAPPTPAPPTAAPLTPSPPTLAPLTQAPATLSPPTDSPPTPAPQTNSPPTAAPPTQAPPTSAPPTNSPPTPFPSTPAPVTPSPPTSAPLTLAPPTQAPLTQAPSTPVPPTAVPTQPPLTQAPLTRSPATSAPSTQAPVTAEPTAVPPTIAPTTLVPTSAPATPAPLTDTPTAAPLTSAPTTVVPSPVPLTAQPTFAPLTSPPATPVPETPSPPVTSVPTPSPPVEKSERQTYNISSGAQKALDSTESAGTVLTLTTVGSLVSGSAGPGALTQRVAMITNKLECLVSNEDAEYELPRILHPLGFKLNGNSNAGCVVGNILLTVGTLMVCGAAGFAVGMVSKEGTLRRGLGLVRFPSIAYVVVLFFFPGTVQSALELVLYPADGMLVVGLLGLLYTGAVLASIVWFTCKAPFSSYYNSLQRTSPVAKYMLGTGTWESVNGTQHTEQHGLLFDSYSNERKGVYTLFNGRYALVEVGHILPLTLATVLRTTSKEGCALKSALLGIIMLAVGVHCLLTGPYCGAFLNHLMAFTSVVPAAGLFLFTVAFVTDNDKHWGIEVGTWCLFAGLMCCLVRTAYDMVTMALDMKDSKKVSLQEKQLGSMGEVSSLDLGMKGAGHETFADCHVELKECHTDPALTEPLITPDASQDDLTSSQLRMGARRSTKPLGASFIHTSAENQKKLYGRIVTM